MIAVLVKVTLVWALALVVARSLRRGSAAMRHLVCAAALVTSALMPLVMLVPPRLEVVKVPLVLSVSAATRVTGEAWQVGSALIWIWCLGLLLVLVRVSFGFWRVSRVRSGGQATGNHGAVPIYEAAVSVPVAVGFFRPAILMPEGSSEWPTEYWDAALRHEEAHIRRYDLWTSLLAHLVCAAYWFHPLVWILARRLREEQELACDDVAVVSGTSPEVYAEALVAAARFLRSQGHTSLIGCQMITNKTLQHRITRLVGVSLPRVSSTLALRWVAAASLTVAVGVGVVTAQAPGPATPEGRVYMMSEGIQAPKLIDKVQPEYTEEARAGKISGTVMLSIIVGTDGLAHDINVLRGLDGGLDLKAVEAVRKWHFKPGTKEGEPVRVRAQIEINFKLN